MTTLTASEVISYLKDNAAQMESYKVPPLADGNYICSIAEEYARVLIPAMPSASPAPSMVVSMLKNGIFEGKSYIGLVGKVHVVY